MKFLQLRKYFSDTTTISEVYLETIDPANLVCYHLEDRDRELHDYMSVEEIKVKKVAGQTAIPYGQYEIVINRSERFSKKASEKAGKPVDVFMPQLLNVKGFEGVRIHTGNKAEHTEGCQLTGSKFVDTDPQHPGYEQVADSQKAYDKIFGLIQDGLKKGKVFIEIQKHPEAVNYTVQPA